jgi:hypothetical protein
MSLAIYSQCCRSGSSRPGFACRTLRRDTNFSVNNGQLTLCSIRRSGTPPAHKKRTLYPQDHHRTPGNCACARPMVSGPPSLRQRARAKSPECQRVGTQLRKQFVGPRRAQPDRVDPAALRVPEPGRADLMPRKPLQPLLQPYITPHAQGTFDAPVRQPVATAAVGSRHRLPQMIVRERYRPTPKPSSLVRPRPVVGIATAGSILFQLPKMFSHQYLFHRRTKFI